MVFQIAYNFPSFIFRIFSNIGKMKSVSVEPPCMRRGFSRRCLNHKTLEIGTKLRYHLLQEGFPDSTYAAFWLGCPICVFTSCHIHYPGNTELHICCTVCPLTATTISELTAGGLRRRRGHISLFFESTARNTLPVPGVHLLNGDGSVNRMMIILGFWFFFSI